jgi:predicted nuclease of restriction endonuclease-like (RecB) superfamily
MLYDGPDEAVYVGIRETLARARQLAHAAVNSAMVNAYWEVGRQIVEAQGGRTTYGKGLLRYLSDRLTSEFGPGFDETNLRKMRQFFQAFPIRDTLCLELSWSHYRLLMRIDNTERRDFYTREAAESGWTVRQLDRQINSFFYERLLATQEGAREEVRAEIAANEPKTTSDDLLRDPYVFEFLGLQERGDVHEAELEQALINKLQDFLLELGKGFSFVTRQKRISDNTDHYYVDLVFYNYILKCFVLFDLKVGKLTHQDIGQMDFYRRVFDEKVRQSNDNPTIGVLLCSSKSEAVVKYSVVADEVGVFASKYLLYLPTEEELRQALTREREALEEANSDPFPETLSELHTTISRRAPERPEIPDSL